MADEDYRMEEHRSDLYDSGLETGAQALPAAGRRRLRHLSGEQADPDMVAALQEELNATRLALRKEMTRVVDLRNQLAERERAAATPPVAAAEPPAAAPGSSPGSSSGSRRIAGTLDRLSGVVEQLAQERSQTQRELAEITRTLQHMTSRVQAAAVSDSFPRAATLSASTAARPAVNSPDPTFGPLPAQPGLGSGSQAALTAAIAGHGTTAATMRQEPGPLLSPRAWRLLGGIAVLLLALLAVTRLPSYFAPISEEAVVNARLHWVRAPITGSVRPASINVGEMVRSGRTLAVIENHAIDTTEHDRLLAAQRESESRLGALRNEAAELERELVALGEAVARVKETLLAGLEEQLAQARARRDTQREAERALAGQLARVLAQIEAIRAAAATGGRSASPGSNLPLSTIEAMRQDLVNLRREAEESEVAVNRLLERRTTIQAEVFAGLEVPAEILRQRAAVQRLSELHQSIQQQDYERAQRVLALRDEEARLARLRRAEVSAPVSGPLWRIVHGPEVVTAGDRILALADAATIAIDCRLPRRHQRYIAVGDRVLVRLLKQDRVVEGTVRLLHEQDEMDHELAIATPSAGDRTMRITVILDDPRRPEGLVGQHAQVMVVSSSIGFLGRAAMGIYSLLYF